MDLGHRFFLGIPGPSLDRATEGLLEEIRPGGIILFGRNVRSASQVARLTSHLRQILGPRLLICLDHEGGRVNRLKEIVGVVPSAIQLGFLKRRSWAAQHGHLTGRLLHELGVNVNLAPVLDLWLRPNTDNSVPDRCWSRDPEEVSRMAGAFLAAMQREGVTGCGKHFLGYGAADKDPHLLLPQVNRSKRQVVREDMLPYSRLLACRKKMVAGRAVPLPRYSYGHLAMIMLSHAHLRAYHGRQLTPASVSPRIAAELLRERLGFAGVSITDDLEMGAIVRTMTVPQAVTRCLAVGVDFLLICHTAKAMRKAAHAAQLAVQRDGVSRELLNASRRRIEWLKRSLPPPASFSARRFRAIKTDIRRFSETVFAALPTSMRPIDARLGAIGEKY
jgi:beta-N-acetylhexosaminidase